MDRYGEGLKAKRNPLSSLESSTPLNHFDILGFSLQYELCFTNVLNMLNLCRIPFFSKEEMTDSLSSSPEALRPLTQHPFADFFDAFVIGDGEEVVLEICDRRFSGKRGDQ